MPISRFWPPITQQGDSLTGCGLTEASSEHRTGDAIQCVTVNVQGGARVGQQQLDGWKVISIKRHRDGYLGLLGPVLGLPFGWGSWRCRVGDNALKSPVFFNANSKTC